MNLFNSKYKILSIFAHREDHVVFGWPVLQNAGDKTKVSLLTCVNEYCEVIKTSCILENIKYVGNCGLKNGFASPHSNILKNKFLPNNYDYLKDEISAAIKKVKPDLLFCHNPIGEYGHYDHRMVFEVVFNEFTLPTIITDITAKSSYYQYHDKIPQMFEHFYRGHIEDVEPDTRYYERNKLLFEKNNLWTNNQNLNVPIYPKKCGLYVV